MNPAKWLRKQAEGQLNKWTRQPPPPRMKAERDWAKGHADWRDVAAEAESMDEWDRQLQIEKEMPDMAMRYREPPSASSATTTTTTIAAASAQPWEPSYSDVARSVSRDFRVEHDLGTGERRMQMREGSEWIDLAPRNKVPDRLREAAAVAEREEDFFVRIEITPDGVLVMAKSGDNYESRSMSWEAIEEGIDNPLIILVQDAIKELASREVMARAERMAAHG